MTGLVFGLVSLIFLSHIAILGGNDKIYESEIWHVGLGSTRKNKIIQWVLDDLVGLVFDLAWWVWFF